MFIYLFLLPILVISIIIYIKKIEPLTMPQIKNIRQFKHDDILDIKEDPPPPPLTETEREMVMSDVIRNNQSLTPAFIHNNTNNIKYGVPIYNAVSTTNTGTWETPNFNIDYNCLRNSNVTSTLSNKPLYNVEPGPIGYNIDNNSMESCKCLLKNTKQYNTVTEGFQNKPVTLRPQWSKQDTLSGLFTSIEPTAINNINYDKNNNGCDCPINNPKYKMPIKEGFNNIKQYNKLKPRKYAPYIYDRNMQENTKFIEFLNNKETPSWWSSVKSISQLTKDRAENARLFREKLNIDDII